MGGFALLTQVVAQPIALFKKTWEKWKGHQWYSSSSLSAPMLATRSESPLGRVGAATSIGETPAVQGDPGLQLYFFLLFFFFDQNWSTFWNSSYDHRPRNIDQDWNLQQHFVMVLSLKSDRSSVVEEAQRFKTIVLVSLSGRLHSTSLVQPGVKWNQPFSIFSTCPDHQECGERVIRRMYNTHNVGWRNISVTFRGWC